MHTPPRTITADLAIIGTGLAGTAAAVFASNRKIACAIAGNTGALAYTTGYFDLLGFFDGRFVGDPWEALAKLQQTTPQHPLAGISSGDVRRAFTEFIAFIGDNGITYSQPGSDNLRALTPAGTLKPTLCLPATMSKGVEAISRKAVCTICGFHGLKGFSANQIAANLQNGWPKIQARQIQFPSHLQGELYAEVAARSLEVPANRKLLARILESEAGQSEYIGLPAILGIHRPDNILEDLEQLTGRRIFEIPTMPPSVPGIRLREMFEQQFPQRGIAMVPQQRIERLDFTGEKIALQLKDNHGPITISAKTALLATGRFLSGGLKARFDSISEPLAGLPVHQPSSREQWYQDEYLDSRGHEIHQAGIDCDASFRPLGKDGTVFDPRLFSAGIILAHQDWIRQRCGAGVAIATAYRAVQAVEDFLAE